MVVQFRLGSSNNKVKVGSVKMMVMTIRILFTFFLFLLLRVFSVHCVSVCMQCMHAHLTGTTLLLSSPNTNKRASFRFGTWGKPENHETLRACFVCNNKIPFDCKNNFINNRLKFLFLHLFYFYQLNLYGNMCRNISNETHTNNGPIC